MSVTDHDYILFYKTRLIIVPAVRLILFPRGRCELGMQLACVCSYEVQTYRYVAKSNQDHRSYVQLLSQCH